MKAPLSKLLEEIDRRAFKKDITRFETEDKDIGKIKDIIMCAIMSFAKGRIPKTKILCINVILDYGNDDGDQFYVFVDANTLYIEPDDFFEEVAKPQSTKIAQAIEKRTDIENMRSYRDAQKIIISVFQYKEEV